VETHAAIGEREQGVVLAEANIGAGVHACRADG
jgi:hypothetical protein